MKAIIFALFALLALSSTVKAQNCGTCELVIQFVEQWVESNATETQIQQYLDSLCALIPGYQATCDGIVATGLTQIIAYINADETPEQVCTQIGLCTSKFYVPFKQTLPSFNDLQRLALPKINYKPKFGDAECDGCEEVINVIEQWLDQSNNQDEVINAVEVVCSYMPSWSSTCDAIVAAGVPAVVNWIDTYENASTVCTQLGLCGNTKKVPVVHVTDDCGECQQIVATIENWVASNTSETAIAGYLDIVCTVIPQWTQTCDNVIAAEIPQIIAYINNNENPLTVCTNLGVCSAAKPLFLEKPIFIN